MKRVTIAVCDECGFENSKDNFCENCNKEIQWSTFVEETEYKQAAAELAAKDNGLDKLVRYLINEGLVETDDMPNNDAPDEAVKVIAALRARVGELEQERDEAINNANNYRARVFDFLDGMTNESQMTQDTEERRGLEPIDREQYRNAIAYIRKAFENHNYLTEAKLAGSFAGFTVYASGEEAAALAKGAK